MFRIKWFCKTMEAESRLQEKITNLVQETFRLAIQLWENFFYEYSPLPNSCIRTVIAFGAQRQIICK